MEDICRTCLKSENQLSNLYVDVKLMFQIERIAAIELSNDPFYPSKICTDCVNNVNNLFNFRKVIINSHRELQNRYETFQRSKEKVKWEIDDDKNVIKTEDELVIESHDLKLELTYEGGNTKTNIAETRKAKIGTPMDTIVNDDDDEDDDDEDDKYECKECPEMFRSRYKLFAHRKSHPPKGVCNVCGLTIRIDNLKRHIQLHSESPVACDICEKTFKNSESLRSHKRIHQSIIFTCEICGRGFKVKSEYKRHMKSHVDPEAFKVTCKHCGKKVRDMKKHMQSHTGERPHMCSYCAKGFTSPYALKVHTRQHTNEKPYICEFCPMAFPQKVSLVTHIKSRHKHPTLDN